MGIFYKLECEPSLLIREEFRTLHDLPYRRIDRREECVGFLDDRMDMGDYETVGVLNGLSVDLTAAYYERS